MKIIVTIFILCFSLLASSQNYTICGPNLLPNPGFEEVDTFLCAAGIAGTGQIWIDTSRVVGWYGTTYKNGGQNGVTPDHYYTGCTTGNSTDNCGEGVGSLGVYTSTNAGSGNSNIREHIQAQLNTPLEAGEYYRFRASIKSPVSSVWKLSDGYGAWFRQASSPFSLMTDNGGFSFINAQPQIMNPPGNIITPECQILEGIFCAEGGENWIILGNFLPDNQMTITGAGTFPATYVIVDDVSLQKICIADYSPFDALELVASDTVLTCSESVTISLQGIVTAPYTIQWISPVSIAGNNTAGPFTETPDSPTLYTVVLTTTNNCQGTVTDTLSVFVNINTSLNLSVNSTPVTCIPIPLCNATATVVTTGGTPTSYQWYDEQMNPISGAVSATANNLCPGMYYVGAEITDQIWQTKTIFEDDFDGVSVWTLNVSTGNNQTSGSFTLGNGKYHNVWTIGDGEGGISPPQCQANGNGNKTLFIRCNPLNNFCNSQGATYLLGETNMRAETPAFSTVGFTNMKLEFDFTAEADGVNTIASVQYYNGSTWNTLIPNLLSAQCDTYKQQWEHVSIQLPADVLNVPNAKIGFNWKNPQGSGPGDVSHLFKTSIAVNNLSVIGDTLVHVTCSEAVSFTIEPCNDCFAAINQQNPIICNGESITLIAIGGNNYMWNNGLQTQSIAVSPENSTTYSVTVSSNDCSASASVYVEVLPSQTIEIISNKFTFCTNDQIYQFSATPANGTWSGNGMSPDGNFNAAEAGVGTHIVTYIISGNCGDEQSVEVTVNETPVVDLGSDQSICIGDTLILDAGSGFDTYLWFPQGEEQLYAVIESGMYSVTVSTNNCYATDSIYIDVVQLSEVEIILPQLQFCSNDSDVQFSATPSGGTWFGDGITESGLFSPVNLDGNSMIVYTLSDVCGNADTTFVTVNTAPDISLGNDTTLCYGDTLYLSAGQGYASYLWSTADTTEQMYVTSEGTYSVTVTNENMCTADAEIFVIFEQSSNTEITSTVQYCLNGNSVQFTAIPIGGQWYGNGISNSGIFSPSTAGIGAHTIIYSMLSNCIKSDTVEVEVFDIPYYNVSYSDETCRPAEDGTILIEVNNTNYSILWNNGSSVWERINLKPGTYSFSITDTNHCSVKASITIQKGMNDCNPPHVYIPNIFSPNGDGENDVFYIRGYGIEEMELIIYNRWGTKVATITDSYQGWDGSKKGKPVDQGVYTYMLTAFMKDNSVLRKSGTITLVR